MQNLEKCMDDMMINTKMMEELMSQDQNADSTADQMLNALKGELAMETENQVNEAALIQQNEIEFQENLKKLWPTQRTDFILDDIPLHLDSRLFFMSVYWQKTDVLSYRLLWSSFYSWKLSVGFNFFILLELFLI